MIRIQIDNRIRISRLEGIPNELIDELKLTCTHENPDRKKWLKFRKGYPPKEFEPTWRRESDGYSFPRGRLPELLEVLRSHDREIVNETIVHPVQFGEWIGPEPWEKQWHLIHSFLSLDTLQIWRSPPASGKTNAALRAIRDLGQRTLVIAPTDAIFEQWVQRARQNIRGCEVGIIKGKKIQIRDLTIGSQKTVHNHIGELKDQFGLIVVDECQLAASWTYQETIDKFTARHRLAISGHEKRADEKEYLIYDQFGTVVREVTRQEAEQAGMIVDVEVRIVESRYDDSEYRDLPHEMHFDRNGKRLSRSDIGRTTANHRFSQRKQLEERMARDVDRNALIVRLAQRCLEEREQVVVLSARREHCLRLDAMLSAFGPTSRFMGDDADFEESRSRFASGECKVAVGTFQKIGVGFESHRALARGVMASPVVSGPQSKMQFDQYRGRFARASTETGKRKAIVYYVHDHRVFGTKPVKLLAEWCRVCTVEDERGKVWTAQQYLGQKRKASRDDASKDNEQTELFRSATNYRRRF